MGLDALVVIGGNGSLSVACKLHHDLGLPIVGVPKTIDNDIVGTDMTFGFNTAVQIATDAIDRLHTTAESHDRVMVVEVMGRHSGWIATYAGIAGGATAILIPEEPFDIDEVCALLRSRHERGRYASIVVVAEGAEPQGRHDAGRATKVYDQFGHVRLGGIAETIAHAIEERTGFETRMVLLGHIQRGGTPTAFDRVLSHPLRRRGHRRRARRARGATWWRCAATTSLHCAAHRDRGQDPPGRHAPVPRGRRGLLRLSRARAVTGSRAGGRGDRRVGRLRRQHQARGSRRRVSGSLCSSPLPAGHCWSAPSTRIFTDCDAVELGGGEHDLGDRRRSAPRRTARRSSCETSTRSTPPRRVADSSCSAGGQRRAELA